MTAEQVKSSVLQECERLTKYNDGFEFYPFLKVEKSIRYYSIYRIIGSRNQLIELCSVPTVGSFSDDDVQFEIAYRLLGLPKQDSKWERLKQEFHEGEKRVLSHPTKGLSATNLAKIEGAKEALVAVRTIIERLEQEDL